MARREIPRKVLVGFVAIGALTATPALSAPPAAPDWTGFYLDGGIGYQNDNFNWAYAPIQPNVAWSESKGSASWTAHIGYQQQFSWLVVGAELGGFRSMGGNWATKFSGTNPINAPCGTALSFQCQAAINYGTDLAGGKLGVDWRNWLFYAVGGVAFNANIASQIVNPAGGLFDVGSSAAAHGWYIGGGFDYLLLKSKPIDLIAGVEYEHVQLGNVAECSVQTGGATFCPGSLSASNYSRTLSASQNAVWVKLTVKWNPFNY